MKFNNVKNRGFRMGVLFWTAMSAYIAVPNLLVGTREIFVAITVQILIMWGCPLLVTILGKNKSEAPVTYLFFERMLILALSAFPFYLFNLYNDRNFSLYLCIYFIIFLSTIACVFDGATRANET
jgi:hypothetical protein